MFLLKQEKANNTLLPLYIFLSATHLNLIAKGWFHMSWLFPQVVVLQYKNIFKIFSSPIRKLYQKKDVSSRTTQGI